MKFFTGTGTFFMGEVPGVPGPPLVQFFDVYYTDAPLAGFHVVRSPLEEDAEVAGFFAEVE